MTKYALLGNYDTDRIQNAKIIASGTLEELKEIKGLLSGLKSGYLEEMEEQDRKKTEELLDKLAEHDVNIINEGDDYVPEISINGIAEIKMIGE